MAIQFRTASTPANAASPQSVSLPAGTTTGDLLMLHVAQFGNQRNLSMPSVDGWAYVPKSMYNGNGNIALFYKYAGASEPDPVIVGPLIGDTLTIMGVALIAVYDDLGGTVTFGDIALQDNASGANRIWPSVTPTTSADMLCCFGHITLTVGSTADPAMTEKYDFGANVRNYMMFEQLASSSATGTRTAGGGGPTASTCVSVILTIDTVPTPPFPGPAFRYRSAVQSSAATTGGSRTIPAADRLQVGDLMVLEQRFATSGIRGTPPVGWIAVPNGYVAGHNSIDLYYKIAEAGDIGTAVTMTWTPTTAVAQSMGLDVFYSPSGKEVFIDDSQKTDQTVTSTSQVFPSVTVTKPEAVLLLAYSLVSTGANFAEPLENILKLVDTSNTEPRVTSFIKHVFAPGATGTVTVASNITSASHLVTIAIAERQFPLDPADLAAAVVSESEIGLSWTAGLYADGYDIERSPNGSTGWTVVGTTDADELEYVDFGLIEDTTYYYRVKSTNPDGDSGYSNVDSATTWPFDPYNPPWPGLPATRLFVLDPRIVFAARVNQGSFSNPLEEVNFNTVTTGAYTDIRPGMTVIFGSAAGLDNHGRQRIRSAPDATTLFIGRAPRGTHDGELDLLDNDYITVYDLYQVWPKIMFIASDGTIYKDTQLEVDDNTTFIPPVANTGPAYAGTIVPEFDAIYVTLSAAGSYSPYAVDITYLWDVEDGTIISGTVTSETIVVTFPAGFRYVHLTVTDTHDKSHTAHCPVFARDPDDDRTIDGFQIESHKATQAGQELSIRLLQPLNSTDWPDGTLVMLFTGEPTDGDSSNLKFCGWMHTEPQNLTAQRTATLTGAVLNCLDVGGKLNTMGGFPQIVADEDLRNRDETPDITWSYMVDPSVDRYLHYLLYWHSTALEVADFYPSGTGPSFPFLSLNSDGGTLYDQVNKRAQALTPDYVLTCNRRGQLKVLPDPQAWDLDDRTDTIRAFISEAVWSDVRWTHQRTPRIYWLRGQAIATTPRVVFAARVNQGSFTFPLSEITYDTVTTGAYTDILPGQRMVIGSAAGLEDRGRGLTSLPATASVVKFVSVTEGTGLGEFDPANNDYITITGLDTYFSVAPGESPGVGGQAQVSGERLAQSQEDLNIATGHRYARLNWTDTTYQITLAVDDDFDIDPAEMVWIDLAWPADLAPPRGGALDNERGLVLELNIKYTYTRTGSYRTIVLTWERETYGPPAATENPA